MEGPDHTKPYICKECAEKRGGTWPPGHLATMHASTCEYCGQHLQSLAHISDWNWPNRKAWDREF